MQVLKFGGSSVANADNILKVVNIVSKAVDRDRTILVSSAISGCTDTLIEIGRKAAKGDDSYCSLADSLQERHNEIIRKLISSERSVSLKKECDEIFSTIRAIAQGVRLLGELSSTSLDAIQGCGELLSTKILSTIFASTEIPSLWVDARKIIKTHDTGKGNAVDTTATGAAVRKMVEDNPGINLFIVPGFIASGEHGKMTTLGRGGSDYSASLIAVAIKARQVEIWTDVNGMMTANPKVVPSAQTITNISYRAALELSHFGAKVIYPPTIQPVVSECIPIYVKNTFDPEAYGTLIEKDPKRMMSSDLTGISNSDNIALLSLEGSGMVGVPNFSSRLFATLSNEGINIILITQASSLHTMCIAIAEKDAEKARKAADRCFEYEISLGKINPLKVEKGYSIVCLVGEAVTDQSRTAGRMMAALGIYGIPVRATAQGSSERNISVIVPSECVDDAIRQLHKEFFEKDKERIVSIFLAGYGTVGKALIRMVASNGERIRQLTGNRLVVKGISNSRRYILNTRGIELSNVDEALSNGEANDNGAYFEALSRLSPGHSVFVDCTASEITTSYYRRLMMRGYNVVASNKLAFAAPYSSYAQLKKTALEHGRSLKYETSVGAALPVLKTIRCAILSGDSIRKVEAVLSGTLNYIFSTYKGGSDGVSFAEVVKNAQEGGYSEPDPRQDLSGNDVLRKLVILAREAGAVLEKEQVKVDPVLDGEYFEGSVESFYSRLAENEASFASAFAKAAEKGRHLRFIACLEQDSGNGGWKASMGVREIAEDHPMFNLEGTDNCVMITSDYYPRPIVVKGAGAGAEQTANGVLDDILMKYL